MHKLLVAIDSSDNAMRALDYALRLAKENAPMHLVLATAHEEPIVYGELSVYMHEDKARQFQRERSEETLAPAIAKAKAAGVPYSSEILVGHVAPALVACADKSGCDAIVIGTRGMGAIGNLLMGSVATNVTHLTRLPVILVK